MKLTIDTLEGDFVIPPLEERAPIPKGTLAMLAPRVGAIVIYGALVELGLAHWLALVLFDHELGAYRRPLPFAVGCKVKLLRKLVPTRPELAPLRSQILDIVDSYEQIATYRNDLAHGALSYFGEEPEPFVVVVKSRQDKGASVGTLTDHVLTIRGIDDIADLLPALLNEMNAVSVELLGRFSSSP